MSQHTESKIIGISQGQLTKSLKRKPGPKVVSLLLKPRITNLDLIPDPILVSAFLRNVILMGQFGVF